MQCFWCTWSMSFPSDQPLIPQQFSPTLPAWNVLPISVSYLSWITSVCCAICRYVFLGKWCLRLKRESWNRNKMKNMKPNRHRFHRGFHQQINATLPTHTIYCHTFFDLHYATLRSIWKTRILFLKFFLPVRIRVSIPKTLNHLIPTVIERSSRFIIFSHCRGRCLFFVKFIFLYMPMEWSN